MTSEWFRNVHVTQFWSLRWKTHSLEGFLGNILLPHAMGDEQGVCSPLALGLGAWLCEDAALRVVAVASRPSVETRLTHRMAEQRRKRLRPVNVIEQLIASTLGLLTSSLLPGGIAANPR